MALTARHSTLGILDTSGPDVDSWWPQVHKTGQALVCRGCDGPMVAVERTTGGWTSRYFRHKALADCPVAAGESEDHRRLKADLAHRIRRHDGWTAELEVAGDSWRADVLATGPGERRIAWEVQLANSAINDLQERSDRYAAAGVEVVWVALRRTGWFGHVPSLLLEPGENGDWMVVDGARALIRKPLGELYAVRPGRFEPPPKVEGTQVAPQRPVWTWRRLLAAGTVPDRLGPLTVPAWLWKGRRRGNVLWRAAKPVALDHVIWSVLAGSVVPVALDEPCVDIAKTPAKPVEVAWVRRKTPNVRSLSWRSRKGGRSCPATNPMTSARAAGSRCCGCTEGRDGGRPLAWDRFRLDAPASELVQPLRVRRNAPAPTQLVW